VGREPHCSKGEREKIIELKKCFANAVKYEWKPEKRGATPKTTILKDRRIVRFSKTNPFASSRHIKANLSLRISDVTIRRRLLDKNLNARSP